MGCWAGVHTWSRAWPGWQEQLTLPYPGLGLQNLPPPEGPQGIAGGMEGKGPGGTGLHEVSSERAGPALRRRGGATLGGKCGGDLLAHVKGYCPP